MPIVICPLCGSNNMCNVYTGTTYEYLVGEDNYIYDDDINTFLYAQCDDCGSRFPNKIEKYIEDIE